MNSIARARARGCNASTGSGTPNPPKPCTPSRLSLTTSTRTRCSPGGSPRMRSSRTSGRITSATSRPSIETRACFVPDPRST